MKKYFSHISVLLTLLLLTACGGGGGSSTSINTPTPGGSVTTTLTIVKTSLAANESTTVTATFTDNGRALAGMPVTFSVTPGLATLNPANGQVTTDGNGVASVVLTAANTTGVGELTAAALINGTNVTKTSPFFVDTKGLKLSSPTFNPSNSIKGGGSTVVSVNILDANGNIYKEQDVDVYFSANSGFFVTDNSVGKVRSSNGVASATYTFAGTTSSSFTDAISVNLGASTVTSYITVNPLDAVNLAYVTALPNNTTLNYSQLITFTFRVTDAKGTGLPNQTVNFSIGGVAAGATLLQTSAVSDVFGNVSTTLKAGTSSTSLWAVATLASGTQAVAQSPVVTVTSQTPASITAGTPASTSLNYGENTLVSFTVSNASGIALPGQVVNFSIDDTNGNSSTAATLLASSATTDANGVVTASVNAGNAGAVFRVKAVVNGTTLSGFSPIITINSQTALTISAGTPSSTTVFSGESAAVTFTVKNDQGVALPGKVISFSVVDTAGAASSAASLVATTATTNANGSVVAAFTAGSTAGAAFKVKAVVSGSSIAAFSQSVTISASANTNDGTLTMALSSNTPRSGDIIMASVQFTGTTAAPYAAKTVTIVSDNPSVIPNKTGTTDSQGKVNIVLSTGNVASGTARVNLYAQTGTILSSVAVVTVSSTSVNNGALTIALSKTTPVPGEVITVTATYTNANANTLAGIPITITSSLPNVIPNGSGTTDASGKAFINLQVATGAIQNAVASLYGSTGTVTSPVVTASISQAVADAAALTLTAPTAGVAMGTPLKSLIYNDGKVVFKTSQGIPIAGQGITISVERIDGWVAGDSVTMNGTVFGGSATPAATVTLNTDTAGTVLMPTIITGANSADKKVVYWKATTTWNGTTYIAYGSTAATIP